MKKMGSYLPSAALALALMGVGGSALAQDDIIVVRGTLSPDPQRQTPEIANVLNADALARIGDSDIAGALRRVSGISVTGGRFPVARGLNERYSAVTLNGVPIPSPEPLRRAAPLDIIPTSVIGGSVAQKTFSPQFSGEFGGAAIDLQTIARPADDFLKLEVGFAVDTETTLKDGLFYEGSGSDVYGWDDGLRDLPGLAAEVIATGTPSDQAAFDTSFEQDDTLLIAQDDVPADASGSATLGKILDLDNGFAIGSTTYVGYSNEWEHREGFADRNDGFAGGVFTGQPQEFSFVETRQNIQLNALNTTGFQSPSGDHEVALTTYILRDTLKRARVADVIAVRDVGDDPLRQENTDWIERQIWQAQLNGNHLFPSLMDLEMNWRLSYGQADRDAPYERKTTRQLLPDTNQYQFFNNTNTDNTLVFSELSDENFFAAMDFTLPFEVADAFVEFKFGGSYTDNSRETSRNVFSFGGDTQLSDINLAVARTDIIYSDTVLASDILDIEYVNTPQEPDSSTGDLEVYAGYLMANVELTDFISFSGGVRYEDGTQESTAQLIRRPDLATPFPSIEEEYFLPSATVTWEVVPDLQVRAGYSQTIARPQFRELVFSDFLDLDYDIVLRGNPFLENAELDNYDIRAEYYFGRGEFVTLGVFYKEIDNPIEQYKTTGEDEAFSFINAPSAEIFGVEAEFTKRFALEDFLDADWVAGKDLLFSTNYTYSDSEVQASAGDTVILTTPTPTGVTARPRPATQVINDGRQLVGQSDHLFNFQLGIEDPETNLKATLLLNYASERVVFAEAFAGESSPPAVVEQPPVSLDFVYSQDVEIAGGIYGLGLKVQNILGEDFNTFREDNAGTVNPFLEYDQGTEFSVSLSREF